MNAHTTIHCPGEYERSEAENARLRDRVAELEYEVQHWKREAFQLVEVELTATIQSAFDLTPVEATVCAALFLRRGKLLPAPSIEGLLDEQRGYPVESNIVCVMISKIREKLGDDVIENVRGRGYRLSEAVLATFDRRLAL